MDVARNCDIVKADMSGSDDHLGVQLIQRCRGFNISTGAFYEIKIRHKNSGSAPMRLWQYRAKAALIKKRRWIDRLFATVMVASALT